MVQEGSPNSLLLKDAPRLPYPSISPRGAWPWVRRFSTCLPRPNRSEWLSSSRSVVSMWKSARAVRRVSRYVCPRVTSFVDLALEPSKPITRVDGVDALGNKASATSEQSLPTPLLSFVDLLLAFDGAYPFASGVLARLSDGCSPVVDADQRPAGVFSSRQDAIIWSQAMIGSPALLSSNDTFVNMAVQEFMQHPDIVRDSTGPQDTSAEGSPAWASSGVILANCPRDLPRSNRLTGRRAQYTAAHFCPMRTRSLHFNQHRVWATGEKNIMLHARLDRYQWSPAGRVPLLNKPFE
ncbi:uncharacterized protein ATNIH1004_002074 [Aspergillus tanneri]|uniref:Uncharacterized protein n=1 Tax=Aspergillus tanneri TaxID=1220188 RepID=A0A5M9M8M6_9EURO|nr:uncharacterized protein ATNIH1004_002074 [Aspergillus tanneri]KAA8641273.1 hypothetical protein ATNIH1004_002074 [Aspergillus tanneri]